MLGFGANVLTPGIGANVLTPGIGARVLYVPGAGVMIGRGVGTGPPPVCTPVTGAGTVLLTWLHCGIWQQTGSFGSGTYIHEADW